ncbi:hypothetical protein M3Y99_01898000 [Aphelenchoides fujianensis]|nr:hypothetical protein M3Y99_01898000 [Aphelenchoides fujianensis]
MSSFHLLLLLAVLPAPYRGRMGEDPREASSRQNSPVQRAGGDVQSGGVPNDDGRVLREDLRALCERRTRDRMPLNGRAVVRTSDFLPGECPLKQHLCPVYPHSWTMRTSCCKTCTDWKTLGQLLTRYDGQSKGEFFAAMHKWAAESLPPGKAAQIEARGRRIRAYYAEVDKKAADRVKHLSRAAQDVYKKAKALAEDDSITMDEERRQINNLIGAAGRRVRAELAHARTVMPNSRP